MSHESGPKKPLRPVSTDIARARRAAFIADNAAALGTPGLDIVPGAAPDALAALAPPDAVFIGGGIATRGVFETCWRALRPGGRLVANAVTIEGEQALFRHEGGLATEFPLNSPYDLAFQNGTLYVAMAGFHQLWELDLPSGQIGPYAGDGIENILDGPRMEARLAQPYGLTASGGMIYFADSETSAVRAVPGIDVDTELAMVETLIGDGLFDFGDRDGAFGDAILQHVQATAVMDDVLYIADSYNHKIKAMDLENRVVETVAGSGHSGATDGGALEAEFNEPAGLACADRQIYVADTNSHAIRVIDLDTEQSQGDERQYKGCCEHGGEHDHQRQGAVQPDDQSQSRRRHQGRRRRRQHQGLANTAVLNTQSPQGKPQDKRTSQQQPDQGCGNSMGALQVASKDEPVHAQQGKHQYSPHRRRQKRPHQGGQVRQSEGQKHAGG